SSRVRFSRRAGPDRPKRIAVALACQFKVHALGETLDFSLSTGEVRMRFCGGCHLRLGANWSSDCQPTFALRRRKVIQQQQYDQGVCREKDCSLYKIAVRTHMLCILSIAKSCFCLGYHATETPPTGPRSFS